MKKTILATLAVTFVSATSALAWEGKPLKCYDKHWVGPKYSTTKVLDKPAKTTWEHNKAGQMVKMYYAPMYMEQKTLVMEGHYVLREAKCK